MMCNQSKREELFILRGKANEFIREADRCKVENDTKKELLAELEDRRIKFLEIIERNKVEMDDCLNAVNILHSISDDCVRQAYDYIETVLNNSLEGIVGEKIYLHKWLRDQKYPQLEIRTGNINGKSRSIKSQGRGATQIISLLCVICIIVIAGERRFLVLDEVLSGVSSTNRVIVEMILKEFTKAGFVFILNEHGFVPKGAKVIHLENSNGVSYVKEEYIEERGVYLNLSGEADEEECEDTEECEEGDRDDEDTEECEEGDRDDRDDRDDEDTEECEEGDRDDEDTEDESVIGV